MGAGAVAWIGLGVAVLSLGCASPDAERRAVQDRALTLSISDLQLHLQSDVYRSFGHLDATGQNAFAVALWRLDRLKEARSGSTSGSVFGDEDAVIEFARGRALSRLRRYRESSEAYARVTSHARLLAQHADHERQLMDVFASLAEAAETGDPPRPSPEQAGVWAETWLHLADVLDDPHRALALIEAESWAQAGVELLADTGRDSEAIRACLELVERHRESKLAPRHLIRLGDLHAESARLEHVRSRAERRSLDVGRYERSLERAFSAYELASEARKPLLRREAESKIEALLAYHEGVRSDVR